MSKKIGQVYKVHSNKYYVKIDDSVIECGARGILKLKNDEILVGDFVEVENANIVCVKNRNNRFIRPNVSNVDIVIAVISPEPKPDYFLLDKLYINSQKEKAEFCIVINKNDLDNEIYRKVKAEYENLGVDILSISSSTGDGIAKLKTILNGKLAVLAGQSAVGKTSITNTMFSLKLKVGELSEKIVRGKHTTTRSEIFEMDNIRIIDSPGFAVIDANVNIKELPTYYPEYLENSDKCKFRGCTHINEPQCEIKQLVNNGILSKKRYERYVQIYNEILNRRKYYEKN